MASGVKNPPAIEAETKDAGLIPGSGRFTGVGNITHSSTLAWKTAQAEEPGGLQSMESQRIRPD